MDGMEQIEKLIEKQGLAFEEFKATHADSEKQRDVLIEEKMARIEKSLDDAVEAKAALELKLEAEKKEREDLELRLSRKGSGTEDGLSDIELKSFNSILRGHAASRGVQFRGDLDHEGYNAYKAAADKYWRQGKDAMYPDELKTLSVGSDPDGGYFVTPDTSGRIVKKLYETSPWRQIANVQTIGSDKLEGIEDLDEAGAGYAGETSVSGNTDTPQVGKWSIPVWWIDTEPKTTQQLLDDANVDIEGWLSGKVVDKFNRFENAEFTNGATKIRGITSYTTAADDGSGVTWGTIGHVLSGASGAFASSNPADKLFDLMGAVKDGYLMNSRWLAKRKTITAMRKFKDTTGQYLWQPSLVMGTPETFSGYAITRAEDLPTMAANSLSLWFGDFNAAYQIVDRSGIRVLRDNLTSKPYVKFYTTKRTGGGIVNFEAIKAMKFATS